MKQSLPSGETHCPLCGGTHIRTFTEAVDNLVSRETFRIEQCACGFLFTSPRPQEEEAGRYYQSEDYISHTSTNQGLINRLYQLARRFTTGKKVRLIRRLAPNGKSLLDYGCGTADFLAAAKSGGWQVRGAEPDEGARAVAGRKHGLEILRPQDLAAGETFDVITLWHVLEHIHRLDDVVAQLAGMLREDGRLVIAVPNAASADRRWYGGDWAAWDVPRHLFHFTPETMNRLLKKHGLTLVRTRSMLLDGFYIAMLSEKNSGNSLWLPRAVFSGMIFFCRSLFKKESASSLIYVATRNASKK